MLCPADSVVTSSSTIMKSLLSLTLFTVNVELLPLFEAPLTVIRSNWLYEPRLIVPVSELLILYSVPVLVKLIIVV